MCRIQAGPGRAGCVALQADLLFEWTGIPGSLRMCALHRQWLGNIERPWSLPTCDMQRASRDDTTVFVSLNTNTVMSRRLARDVSFGRAELSAVMLTVDSGIVLYMLFNAEQNNQLSLFVCN